MRVTILAELNRVIINNVGINFNFNDLIDDTISVVQWYDTYGHIEYKSHLKTNEPITKLSNFNTIIARYNQEKNNQQQEKIDQETEDRASYEASLNFRQRRQREYPDLWNVIELILEKIELDGVTSETPLGQIITQVNTIKQKYPEV